MTDDTLTGLVRFMHDHPADDAPRLLYADRLRELGQDELADAVAYGIANLDAVWTCDGDSSVGMGCIGDESVCPTCSLIEWLGFPRLLLGEDGYKVRRGFVEEVTCPLNAWLRFGAAAVRAMPVRYVNVTDKQAKWDTYETGWYNQSVYPDRVTWRDPNDLPNEVWKLLECDNSNYDWKNYDTVSEAEDALSAALIALARTGYVLGDEITIPNGITARRPTEDEVRAVRAAMEPSTQETT